MPHIHEKIDFVADAFIVHKNRVLLRIHDKYKIWMTPGGHIELDEDPVHAAVREAKEEVGLDIEIVNTHAPIKTFDDSTELIAPHFLNRHRVNENHEHIGFTYFAITKDDNFQQGEGEASPEIRWFTSEELDDPQFGISERIKYYAHAALDALDNIGDIKKS